MRGLIEINNFYLTFYRQLGIYKIVVLIPKITAQGMARITF